MFLGISLLIYLNMIHPRAGLEHPAVTERTRRFYLIHFHCSLCQSEEKRNTLMLLKEAREDVTQDESLRENEWSPVC